MAVHPLQGLSRAETETARDTLISLHSNELVVFREIFLQEPRKVDLLAFLDLEHAGRVTSDTPRPPRLAKCQYDVVGGSKVPSYQESIIDVDAKERVKHEVVGTEHHAALTLSVQICGLLKQALTTAQIGI